MKKIIVRVKGGLGNQLFHYAFAKRLANYNNCKLIIDNVTSFTKYDYLYNRKYNLDNFYIQDQIANKNERLEPYEKLRRNVLVYYSKFKDFDNKLIYKSDFLQFDPRFLKLTINKTVILDGNWQSEGYFKDIEGIIRQNLKFRNLQKLKNNQFYNEIIQYNSVGIHLRSHGYKNPSKDSEHNANKKYYINSINYINSKIRNPHFFIFSDNRTNIEEFIDLKNINYTVVNSDNSSDNPINDFYLLSICKHFITAASTFSWWAAWLSNNKNKIIISPNIVQTKINKTSAWGFKGLIPKGWIII